MPGIGVGYGLPLGGILGWTPAALGSDLKLWLRPESLSNPNRLLQTEDLTNVAWSSNLQSVVGGYSDPSGGTGAFLLTPDGNFDRLSQNAIGFQPGATDTGSIYVMRGPGHDGSSTAWFRIADGVAEPGVTFLPSATWERKQVTRTLDAAATISALRIGPNNNLEPLLVWHPQLESGSTATPYKANGATAGGIVSQWDDSSGLGNHATQASQANMPLVEAGALDGKSGALFDSVDDYLQISGITTLAQPHDVWVVYRRDSAAGDNYLFARQSGDLWYIFARATGMAVTAGTYHLEGSGHTVGSHVVRFLANGASSKQEINGGTDWAGDAGVSTLNIPQLGRLGASSYWDGAIMEVILGGTALTAGERLNMISYLTSRYPSVGWV